MKLSKEEIVILKDSSFLLTKQRLIGQVVKKFEDLQTWHLSNSNYYLSYVQSVFDQAKSGKVSKGENYEGLPYIILDAPRFFTKTNVFAIRTMFWWGNEFSYTLHLAGAPLKKYMKGLEQRLIELSENQFYICVNNTPWEYHFREDNYRPVSDFTFSEIEEVVNRSGFLKLSKRLSIEDWGKLEVFTERSFQLLMH